MIDRGPDDLRWELRQCLADPVPARQRLLALIRAVDLAHDSLRTGNADIEPLVQQVLARAAVTIAPLFTTASEPMDVGIAATAVAARVPRVAVGRPVEHLRTGGDRLVPLRSW